MNAPSVMTLSDSLWCRLVCLAMQQGRIIAEPCMPRLLSGVTTLFYPWASCFYRDRLKGGPQVGWILCLLLLSTSAWPCLQHSRNLSVEPCSSQGEKNAGSLSGRWSLPSLILGANERMFDERSRLRQCASNELRRARTVPSAAPNHSRLRPNGETERDGATNLDSMGVNHIQGSKKWFAKCDKHYPSRFRQTSLATAVANFTKPRTSHFFSLCT